MAERLLMRVKEESERADLTICKIESQWDFAVWLGELKPGLGHNLEGWDGEGGGKDGQVGGDMGKPMADTCWCLIETSTIL